MLTKKSPTTPGRRSGLATTLVVLGVTLALTLGAASSFAALHIIGSPTITGSWTQTFNESGVGNFDHVQILAVTGGPFELPISQSAFSVLGWVEDCDNAIESSATGTLNANMNWDIAFQGAMASPLSFYFQAYDGATLKETAFVSWNGASFTIDNFVPATGTWLGPVCGYLNSVSGIEPFTCLTTPVMCVTIPIDVIRNDLTQMRAFSVNFKLSPELALCGTPAVAVTQGSYLNSLPLSSTDYHVVSNLDGSYTVDCALLGSPCGQADQSGTLFNVSVKGVAEGVGKLTILSVIARDCANVDIACTFGPPVPVTVDFTAPTAIVDLTASQLAVGNGVLPTRGIKLNWATGGAGTVSLYRAPEGAYPEYSDDVAILPPNPAVAPAAPWALVASGVSTGYVDVSAPRGFWRYVAFISDACGNVSGVSNMTGGLLNYLLGDVTPVPGAGDNKVDGLDISLLGFNYGLVGEVAVDAVDYLDVGPTLTGSPSARPKPDDIIGFEDLVIFAIDYGTSVQMPQFAAAPAAMDRDELTVEAPAKVTAGESFTVSLRMKGAGDIQALSSQLGYDRAVVEPVSVKSGELIDSQNGVVFSSGPGNVDAALLGVRGQALTGDGVLATVTFRAVGSGEPKIGLAKLVARDASNQPVRIAAGGPVADAVLTTGLMPAAPNPFQGTASLGFSLARGGVVNLSIISVDGRRVKTLFAGTREAGAYHVTWNGTDDNGNRVQPGVFYARLSTPSGHFSRAITFLR